MEWLMREFGVVANLSAPTVDEFVSCEFLLSSAFSNPQVLSQKGSMIKISKNPLAA